MRNGIPIVQSVKSTGHPQGKVWKAISNPYTRYIEMAMIVDGCEASVVMPYKHKWVQQYISEGWSIAKEWSTELTS